MHKTEHGHYTPCLLYNVTSVRLVRVSEHIPLQPTVEQQANNLLNEHTETSATSSDSTQQGYRVLFQNKPFISLWIGQIFSQLADRIIFVLYIALIVTHFSHEGKYRSLLYIAFTIPAIALTAIAGVFVDRWPRKTVLIVSNLLRAFVIALTPLAIKSGTLWSLYASAFMISVSTQFFAPAESASIPTLVPKNQLLVANSLFTTTMMASLVFGFALGDPLITLMGLDNVHWAIFTLFIMSCLILLTVKMPDNPQKIKSLDALNTELHEIQESAKTVFTDLWEGFKALLHEPKLLRKMLQLTLLFSYVVAMSILFISFAEDFLYPDPVIAARKFPWLIMTSGLGMLLGSYIVGRYMRHRNQEKLISIGFIGVGLSLAMLVFTPWVSERLIHPMLPLFTYRVLFAHVMTTLMGITSAFIAVPLQALLHDLIPEHTRGRVLGIQFTLLSTGSTLPAVFAGFGADYFGVLPMFALMAAPLLLIAGGGLYHQMRK